MKISLLVLLILPAVTSLAGAQARPTGPEPSGNGKAVVRGRLVDVGGQVHNVKAYGAKGDGVTDDTAAIQATVNAAYAANPGASVLIPPGTYVVAGTVTFPSFAPALVGFGGYPGTGSQPKIHCTGAGDCIRISDVVYSPYQSVDFHDLGIEGNNNANSVGIHVTSVTGMTCERLSITNFTGSNSAGLLEDFSDPSHMIDERNRFINVEFTNNTVGLSFTNSIVGAQGSYMYSTMLDVHFEPRSANQIGFLQTGNQLFTHSFINFYGNMACSKCVLWKIDNHAMTMLSTEEVYGEGPSGSTPILLTSTAGGLIGDGHFDFMGLPNSIAAGVPFSLHGPEVSFMELGNVSGTIYLHTQWAMNYHMTLVGNTTINIDCSGLIHYGAGPYSIWIDQNSASAYTVTWGSSYQAGNNVGPGFQGAGTISQTLGSKNTQMFLTDPVQGFTLVALTPMYSH